MTTIQILSLPGIALDRRTFEFITQRPGWLSATFSSDAGRTPVVYSRGLIDVLIGWNDTQVSNFRRLHTDRSMLTLEYEDEEADEIESRINRNAVSLAFAMDGSNGRVGR